MCMLVCVYTHVHVRGDLLGLALLLEVGRNGPQSLRHGNWVLGMVPKA